MDIRLSQYELKPWVFFAFKVDTLFCQGCIVIFHVYINNHIKEMWTTFELLQLFKM